MKKIYTRALFHLAWQGSMLAIAWFVTRPAITLITVLLCLVFVFLEALRLHNAVVNDWFFRWFGALLRQDERNKFTGALFVLVASLLTFGIFPKEIAILALAFLAVGDPAAAIIGKAVKGHRIYSKTLEGNLTCMVACLAAGFILQYFGLGISTTLVISGSFAAAFIQALPIPINDNLSIPLASALVMSLIKFIWA